MTSPSLRFKGISQTDFEINPPRKFWCCAFPFSSVLKLHMHMHLEYK